MNPLISIIVPVYNCEKRIAIFHQSVSNQTFNDFEVIYVDDSSTDSSLDLLNKIKSQEKNVEVKSHLKNLGAGDARNTGLNISRGKYLCFLDADDYIAETYIEVLIRNIELTNADIVVCNYNIINEINGVITTSSKYKAAEYSGNDSLKIFVENLFNPAPWGKIYKKELFIKNKITFPTRIAHQDFATIPLVVERSKKIVVIDDILYNYVQNPEGYSLTAKEIHTYSIFKAFEIIYAHFKVHAPEQLENDLFRQIVVGRFRYNLNQRWNKFTEDHLFKYITNFVNYYNSHKWEKHVLSLVDQALLNCLKKILIKEEYKFLIVSLDQNWLSDYQKYYISNIEIVNLSDKSDLRLSHKNSIINKELKWYSETYDHLPKWFLKIGGIFRRIKFKKGF